MKRPAAGCHVQRQLARRWRLLRAQLVRLTSRAGVETVHQARVEIRRMRSMLAAISPAIDAGALAEAQRVLGGLAKELGLVRDADIRCAVLLPILRAHRMNRVHRTAAARADLAATLHCARHDARTGLHASLRDPAARERWRALNARLAGGECLNPDIDADALLLRATRRRCRKVAGHLESSTGNASARHALRIQLKKCRYLLDACGIEPRDRRTLKIHTLLHELQDCLGELNDLTQTRRWLKQQQIPPELAGMLRKVLRKKKRECLTEFASRRSALRRRDVGALAEPL